MRPLIPMCLLLAAGCVAHVPGTGETLNVQYDCGGYRFTAQYTPQLASVSLPDGRVFNLRQVSTASGSRYTDGTSTLSEQSGVARLELPDAVHNQCVPV